MMTNGALETARMAPKAKVFISYSRADLDFAKRIVAALNERGFEVLIDLSGIEPSEKWWKRIKELITQADTAVFVLSPEAIASKVCKEEVEFAGSLNKRFVPIVCGRVSAGDVPQELRELNWIFFDDPPLFGERMDQLTKALETDIEWIRKHTQFSEFAQRWDAAERPGPAGLMLRPPLLTEAEALIAWRPRGAPEPVLLRAFIVVSREAFDEEQAAIATSQANLLAQVGEAEHLRGNLDTGLKLCVHAARRQLETRNGISRPSRAGATLAAVVSQASWRLRLGGHENYVTSSAYSPDGSRIVTASWDKTARIWDAATGKEITVLRGHEGLLYSAAFSPDGTRIVTASWDKTARIWDAATGKEITVLRGHKDYVTSAAYSPDGSRIVTASLDKTTRIWDAATGKEIIALRRHEDVVYSATFSPDGSRIVTASYDKTARIWDAATGKELMVLRGHENTVRSAAYSPDGSRIVTASVDKTARIWDVHFAMMSTNDLLVEACTRRLRGLTKLSRDEMRVAGYPDSMPEIDVCAGID
jgi:hypothetical protein